MRSCKTINSTNKHNISNQSMQRSSYPVTQYLIERYYETRKELIPNGPNLLDHRDSDELFKVLMNTEEDNPTLKKNMIAINRFLEAGSDDEESDSEDEDEFDRINLPSNSKYHKFVTILNRFFSLGQNSYGYDQDLLIKDLKWERSNSVSYDQWKLTSLKLDDLTHRDNWKLTPESSLYDYKLIHKLTESMKSMRINENYSQLLYIIRTNWKRNLGNFGDVNLYRHCNVGTKKIIHDYLIESELSIKALLSQSELDDNYLLGILQQTKRNIGKTALVLSGGATFGLFHIGILAALFEADTIPKVISGTSAGAIVASIFCIHTTEEIPSLLANVLNMEFNIFKDGKDKSNSEDILIKLSRFLKGGSWFSNIHLKNTMLEFLGNLTFQEAYYRTGKILNITVSPASIYEQPRLLNNLTAPNVLIWSAVCASCSVPGVFPATPLYEKDPKTSEIREWLGNTAAKFVDGSVDNDLPIPRLSEMFNIDHIIACQVNPHVFPFLKNSLSCVGGEVQNELSAKFKQSLTNIFQFCSNEMIHGLDMLAECGIATNVMAKCASILSQQYSGHITILPEISMLNQSYELLRNPSRSFLLRETTLGARAAWPKLSMVKNNCGQEFLLDKAITFLQTKLLMSSSIKNPLQFSDTFNLIKLTNNSIQSHDSNVSITNQDPNQLDSDLVETENNDPLLFIRNTNIEELKRQGRLRSMSLRLNPHTISYPPSTSSSSNNRSSLDLPRRPSNLKSTSFSAKNKSPTKYRKRAGTTITNIDSNDGINLNVNYYSNLRSPRKSESSELHSYSHIHHDTHNHSNIIPLQFNNIKYNQNGNISDTQINRKEKNN
ncbi:triacylglycerol lipase 5 [Monosporozyma unispora]